MPRKKATPSSRSWQNTETSADEPLEWVGGKLTLPLFVQDEETTLRPEMFVWLEPHTSLVVGTTPMSPHASLAEFGDSLLSTIKAPMMGPPRRPSRVRVMSPSLAAEVQAVAPDIEVIVAPTPELDSFLESMMENMPSGEEVPNSYFEGGAIAPLFVERFFAASKVLFRSAPWQSMSDQEALHVSVPSLGIDGACLSVLGAGGESFGFLLFPSYLAFEGFLEAAA